MIQSSAAHPFLFDGSFESRRNAIEQFGLGDDLSQAMMTRIEKFSRFARERYRERFGVRAWAQMSFIASDGELKSVHCFKVRDLQVVSKFQDDYIERVGDTAEIQTNAQGIIVATAPERVQIINGNREISQWLPMMLKLQGDWLFEGSDPYFLTVAGNREIRSPPARLENCDWLYESQPALISRTYRQAMLAQTFAALGTQRQRRDTESLADYSKRVAVLELWEQFLRSRFFDAEKIAAWCTRAIPGHPVRYRCEVTALEGSKLAETISSLRAQTSMPASQEGLFSAAVSCSISESAGRMLSLGLQDKLGDVAEGGFFDSLCASLESGRITTACQIDSDDRSRLTAKMKLRLPPSIQSESVAEAPSTRLSNGVPDPGAHELGPFKSQSRRRKNNELLFCWSDKDTKQVDLESFSSAGHPMAAVFSARLDARLLLRSADGPSGRAFLATLQTLYLQHLYSKLLPHSTPPDDFFAGQVVLELLRNKVINSNPEGWGLQITVHALPKKRMITVDLIVGEQLAGFAPIADAYLHKIAQQAGGFD